MAAIAKFNDMCGGKGKCTPLEEVSTRKLPEIVNIGKKQKLMCQYTGLLCDNLYAAKGGKLFTGWVATAALALDIYQEKVGKNVGCEPTTMSKSVDEAVSEEKKRKENQRKKDELLFFKMVDTNVERMNCKTLFDALEGVERAGVLRYNKDEYVMRRLFFNDGEGISCAVVISTGKTGNTVEKLLQYCGDYEEKPKKLPSQKLPVVIMCPEKAVKDFPRLKMIMNEVKGKMPLKAAKVAAAKTKIAKEQEAEKLKTKHSNSKMPETLPPIRKRKCKALAPTPSGPPPPKKNKVVDPLDADTEIDESALGCDMI